MECLGNNNTLTSTSPDFFPHTWMLEDNREVSLFLQDETVICTVHDSKTKEQLRAVPFRKKLSRLKPFEHTFPVLTSKGLRFQKNGPQLHKWDYPQYAIALLHASEDASWEVFDPKKEHDLVWEVVEKTAGITCRIPFEKGFLFNKGLRKYHESQFAITSLVKRGFLDLLDACEIVAKYHNPDSKSWQQHLQERQWKAQTFSLCVTPSFFSRLIEENKQDFEPPQSRTAYLSSLELASCFKGVFRRHFEELQGRPSVQTYDSVLSFLQQPRSTFLSSSNTIKLLFTSTYHQNRFQVTLTKKPAEDSFHIEETDTKTGRIRQGLFKMDPRIHVGIARFFALPQALQQEYVSLTDLRIAECFKSRVLEYCKDCDIDKFGLPAGRIEEVYLKKRVAPSHLDNNVFIDSNNWAITLVDGGSKGSDPKSWQGHAEILVEGVAAGCYFVKRADLILREGKPLVRLDSPPGIWLNGKSKTWLRPRTVIEEMLNKIQIDRDACQLEQPQLHFSIAGRDSRFAKPIKIKTFPSIQKEECLAYFNELKKQGASEQLSWRYSSSKDRYEILFTPDNCLTWSLGKLALAHITPEKGLFSYLLNSPKSFVNQQSPQVIYF